MKSSLNWTYACKLGNGKNTVGGKKRVGWRYSDTCHHFVHRSVLSKTPDFSAAGFLCAKLEMHRSNIIGISLDIENNFRSGVGDNGPDP